MSAYTAGHDTYLRKRESVKGEDVEADMVILEANVINFKHESSCWLLLLL